MVTHHAIWGRSPLLLMSLVDGHCVLLEPSGWWCLQLDYLGYRRQPSFSGRRLSNLELSTGTHRLSPYVEVLQASLENVFTTTIFLSIAL